MKMIDDLLLFVKNMIEYLPVPVKAGILSFALVILRIAYAKEEKRWFRRMIEGLICSLLTVAIGYTFIALGINETISYGVGAYVGWEGADRTAQAAKKKVNNLLDIEDKKNDV